MSSSTLDRVLSCRSLPSLPAAAIEVLHLTRDPNASIGDIARVVGYDPALSAKILRVANSSYYGLATPCASISRALGYLGLNTVRSMVLGFSFVDGFRGVSSEGGLNASAYWRRALYGAASARPIAQNTSSCDPEEAFTGSLLQDMGMLAAVAALGESYTKVIEADADDHYATEAAERRAFGFTHSQVGALLAQRWGLPDSVVDVIRHHHRPELAEEVRRPLVRSVALGGSAAEVLASSAGGNQKQHVARLARFLAASSEWFGISNNDAASMLKDVVSHARELSHLFQINTGGVPDVDAILAEAEDQRMELQLAMERENSSLCEENEQLAREASTDALTGLGNRKRFDEQLSALFRDARQGSGTLGIVFLDADHFKKVNDTHGHDVGDAVLSELASRIRRASDEELEICRFGGEEIAVIAPRADRHATTRIGEAIRSAVAAEKFKLRDASGARLVLPITVSVGIAALDTDSRGLFSRPEQLLKAADAAVYAAKRAGRNCTRVYVPKSAELPTRSEAPSDDRKQAPDPAPVVVRSRSMQVLLVEDDMMHQRLIMTLLERLDGVKAQAASTVAEAIAVLEGGSFPPSLILLDLELPDQRGVDLIRHLRQETQQMTPIVVLSAADQQDAIRECLGAGANAFVAKQRIAEDRDSLRRLVDFWAMTTALAA